MRYADGPTAEVEVDVDASPETVWAVVTDLNVPARFSDEFQGAEWDGGSGGEVGARFTGRNRHPAAGEWTTQAVVTDYDAPRRFAYVIGEIELPSAAWRFELEPLARGAGTRLRQWARMGPGPSGLTSAIAARPDAEERIVARRLEEWRANMRATVEGIKALAEQANTEAEGGRLEE
ncbi:MAG: SRPBCC family protein [Actinobacteria bacterium]|nr:SRPBCC family protein [Actinomycetota bacterium]